MKIACVSDDQRTISAHFGRAQYYVVVTVEDGTIVHREVRPKLGHQHFAGHEVHQPGNGHGMDPASHDRHVSMAEAIRDCEALLARGMGRGAYLSMERLGITPIATDVESIDQAVLAYAQGRLENRNDRVH
ncbi:MAG TPA: dinitrogenase iron-molybdenum cofactor biosynthesis protein [Chloroflexi bacterium]|nr:dinitrogenase iron-molybdenum cofactor biosynthesis protein [Chloroflexota bacterium]